MKRNTSAASVGALLQWLVTSVTGLRLAVAVDDQALHDQVLMELLPVDERLRAASFEEADERRHYLFRRCLQRCFVSEVLNWQGSLPELPLQHDLDQRPVSGLAPDTCLSFSSSGKVCVFGAAENAMLGVDVERVRPVADVTALSRRFFEASEAEAVAACPEPKRARLFLTLWSAKEAGLKARGLGIVSGLNRFTFTERSGSWHIEERPPDGIRPQWQLHLPPWEPGFIITVMHRPKP